jgi:hypothetical protein
MQINYFPNMTNNFTNLEGITSFSLCLTTSTRRRRHLAYVLFTQPLLGQSTTSHCTSSSLLYDFMDFIKVKYIYGIKKQKNK